MIGSKREGAGRKKKSSLKKVVELEGEIRPNKHRSYLKIVKDEETGPRAVVRGGLGAQLFYTGDISRVKFPGMSFGREARHSYRISMCA
jgi:hypothetical protein